MLAAALLGMAAPAWGQVPELVNYQGLLLDANGLPIGGSVNIEIGVWNDPNSTSLGDLLYQEAHTGVGVVDGVFDLQLGGGAFPVGTFDAALFSDPDRWLQLIVEGQSLSPRQRLLSVPYAMQCQEAVTADDAAQLAGLPASDYQLRVSGGCSVGSYIRAINPNGTVVCGTDARATSTRRRATRTSI